jgi:multidrug efflux pump
MFQAVPGGFIPTQDKLFLIGGVKLPEGASLDRTDEVVQPHQRAGPVHRGRGRAPWPFPGLNAMQFNNTPNAGTVFFGLEDFRSRRRSATAITAELNMKFSGIQEGFAFAFQPPAVLGIGTGSGYSLFVQDRAGLGHGELQHAVNNLSGALAQVPGMGFRSVPTSPTCRSSTPTWIVPRPRPRAWRSRSSSRPCRFISARPT